LEDVPNSQERFKETVEESSERMLEGEETPWSDRDTHRGESPHVEGGPEIDPVYGGPGISSAGAAGTSGSHQINMSATGSGGSSGSGHGVHGRNTEGAFGEEEPGSEEDYRTGDGTKKPVDKLQP